MDREIVFISLMEHTRPASMLDSSLRSISYVRITSGVIGMRLVGATSKSYITSDCNKWHMDRKLPSLTSPSQTP